MLGGWIEFDVGSMLACVCIPCTPMQLDGEPASPCGGSNGTTTSYTGLKDGNHTFTACARTTSSSPSSPTCGTYAWDVG